VTRDQTRELTLMLVAGEHSGDALGAKLMNAIRAGHPGRVRFVGVGGELMQAEGLTSLFPLSDVAVMGPLAILARLPQLAERIHLTVEAAIDARPDAVVIVDSPEFTHPIAKRIRIQLPDLPIIDYVSPSIWAWRPGRAKKMTAYVDHVLALLPFEPAAHARLGGPPCSYVGHPMIERLDWIRGLDTAPLRAGLGPPETHLPLVVLPGSRASELNHLLDVFGQTLARIERKDRELDILIPAVAHLRERIRRETKEWPGRVHVLETDADKFAAFKVGRAALAASGTVTLELALTGLPMVVAYRVDPLAAYLRFLVKVPSVVLANLVLEEKAFPEFLQEDCTPEQLSAALDALIADTPERARQLKAVTALADRMTLPDGSPSERAAAIVLEYAERGRSVGNADRT